MNNKLMVFIVFVFVNLTIISFIVEGEGGLAATSLTTAIGNDDTTLTVVSTTGFLSSDILWLENEIVGYTGKTSTTFTGVVRAHRNTSATSHAAGTRVYNEATGIVNKVVGFNIAETMSTAGAIRTIAMVPGALAYAAPRLVMWDYSYLEGTLFGFPLTYLKYMLLYPISAGFILMFFFAMVNIFMGVARIFT